MPFSKNKKYNVQYKKQTICNKITAEMSIEN